jgi:hypothetical protein
MGLKISRGVQRAAVRAVFYGEEGVGKTSLAAQCPAPLILDVEDGSRHLDVARVPCAGFAEVEAAMHELARDPQGFQTVVIDSADWAERSLIELIVRNANKRSIEDFGFGRGYVVVAERIAKFLATADDLIARGVNVIFVAHAGVKRVSPPDQTDGYDRYELKLTKQTAPLFKEWADLLLFVRFQMRLVEGQDGKKKAVGGRDRVMCAERTAAFDAKNRYGLPAEMPLSIDGLSHIFAAPPLKVASAPQSIESTLQAIAGSSAAALDRLAPKVAARQAAGEITADQRAAIEAAIEARREELGAVTT